MGAGANPALLVGGVGGGNRRHLRLKPSAANGVMARSLRVSFTPVHRQYWRILRLRTWQVIQILARRLQMFTRSNCSSQQRAALHIGLRHFSLLYKVH